MYYIIGGDGKQYGPITDTDLCNWIAEGRLNAQSLAKGESDAEFRPLSNFPEFAEALGTEAPAQAAPASVTASANWSNRNYELDIGGCVSRGWNLYKDDFGTLFGSFLLCGVVLIIGCGVLDAILFVLVPKPLFNNIAFRMCFNVLVQAVLALLIGPLIGGLYYIFISRIRGQSAGAGDLFRGFQRAFSELFLSQFVVSFFIGLCMLPYNIVSMSRLEPVAERLQHAAPGDVQGLMQQMQDMWTAAAGTLPVFFLCLVPVTYLTVNWMFTLPLIIDKQMGFWTAMTTSWKAVHKHWWTVFGLLVVAGLVSVSGVIVCCIGVVFTAPIGTAALLTGYETIFGESKTA